MIKTKQTATKSVKYTAKTSIKATKQTIKTTQKTAQLMKQTAKATIKAKKVTIKVTIQGIKAIIMGTKALIAAILAGGWVAITIILIICLIGLLCSSVFGIFFASENTSGYGILEETKTMNAVILKLNTEFMTELNNIQKSNKHDDYDIISNRADWKEVLAIYAVKVSAGENSTEIVTLSENKIFTLKSIFWEMNTITHTTETISKEITAVDENGNTTTKTETQTILHITISSKNAKEMAQIHNFNSEQAKLLAELLSDHYKNMWSSVIYGKTVGDSDIVEVARS